MATAPSPRLSEEEYPRIERLAETKSEFHDGQMCAMPGGSLNHSLLVGNMIYLIRRQLGAECRLLTFILIVQSFAGNRS